MEVEIKLEKSLTAKNDAVAKKINSTLKEKGILCVNLLGAPGAGKTTLIENLVDFLPEKSVAVIQGDLKSDVDKMRLEKKGIGTYQINTHSGCHLNAHMVEDILQVVNLEGKKFLIIENVGNLVCPAGVLIGQDINVLVSATTEGYDKPEKYPLIFRDAQLIVLSKYDLKDAVDFNEEEFLGRIGNLGKRRLIKVGKNKRNSYREIAEWLEEFK